MSFRTRTNSLGRATTDCHGCLTANRLCDRERPWCRTCEQGCCSGYSQTLTWNEGIASRGKFRGKSLPVTEQTNVQKKNKPSDELQFECYDPTQAQVRKRKRNSTSTSPRIQNRQTRVEFRLPSPEPIAMSMDHALDQLTLDSLTWFQDDSVFDPLPLVSSTPSFDEEPSWEDIELRLSPTVSFNPFQLSPIPSLPSPSLSADNRRLLCYCILLDSFSDSR